MNCPCLKCGGPGCSFEVLYCDKCQMASQNSEKLNEIETLQKKVAELTRENETLKRANETKKQNK